MGRPAARPVMPYPRNPPPVYFPNLWQHSGRLERAKPYNRKPIAPASPARVSLAPGPRFLGPWPPPVYPPLRADHADVLSRKGRCRPPRRGRPGPPLVSESCPLRGAAPAAYFRKTFGQPCARFNATCRREPHRGGSSKAIYFSHVTNDDEMME